MRLYSMPPTTTSGTPWSFHAIAACNLAELAMGMVAEATVQPVTQTAAALAVSRGRGGYPFRSISMMPEKSFPPPPSSRKRR